jgi:membrane protein
MAIVRARVLSFGLILGLVFLLIVSLAVSTAVSAFGTWAGAMLPASELLLQALNIGVSLSIATVLFAMIYKLMPSTPIAWRDVWVGAFTTALLFEVGKMLISLYIGKSGMSETFAAAGSLVVLLAWVYYAAQIFLLGAEFTKVFADDHGSRQAGKAMAHTNLTAVAGMPTEAMTAAERVRTAAQQVPAPSQAPRPARPSPVLRAADAGVQAALIRLVTEVVALAVISAAGSIMQKRRKSAEKKVRVMERLRWGRSRAH